MGKTLGIKVHLFSTSTVCGCACGGCTYVFLPLSYTIHGDVSVPKKKKKRKKLFCPYMFVKSPVHALSVLLSAALLTVAGLTEMAGLFAFPPVHGDVSTLKHKERNSFVVTSSFNRRCIYSAFYALPGLVWIAGTKRFLCPLTIATQLGSLTTCLFQEVPIGAHISGNQPSRPCSPAYLVAMAPNRRQKKLPKGSKNKGACLFFFIKCRVIDAFIHHI